MWTNDPEEVEAIKNEFDEIISDAEPWVPHESIEVGKPGSLSLSLFYKSTH